MRWLIVVLAFVFGCSSPPGEVDVMPSDAASFNEDHGRANDTDAGPAPPCVPKIGTFIDDDGGTHSVTFPCLSDDSTSRGASDPAGWGNDGYEPNEPPGPDFTFPPRTPPGDPVPF